MKKSEMMKQWKEVSELKASFAKTLGKKFPDLCYTDEKLLAEVKTTLTSLTKKLEAVAEGKPESEPKAEKPVKAMKDKPAKAKKATKDEPVKTGVKIGAKS